MFNLHEDRINKTVCEVPIGYIGSSLRTAVPYSLVMRRNKETPPTSPEKMSSVSQDRGEDPDDPLACIKIAESLIDDREYTEAYEYLKEMEVIRAVGEFHTLLLMAECRINLGHAYESKSFQKIRKKVIKESDMRWHDVVNKGKKYFRRDRYVVAIIIYELAILMLLENMTSENYSTRLSRLSECMTYITKGVLCLHMDNGWVRSNAIDYVTEMMEDTTRALVSCDLPSHSKQVKLTIAHCWKCLCQICVDTCRYAEAIALGGRGLVVFPDLTFANDERPKIVGDLAYHVGLAYQNLNQYEMAMIFHVLAFITYYFAEDFKSKKEKKRHYTKAVLRHKRCMAVARCPMVPIHLEYKSCS